MRKNILILIFIVLIVGGSIFYFLKTKKIENIPNNTVVQNIPTNNSILLIDATLPGIGQIDQAMFDSQKNEGIISEAIIKKDILLCEQITFDMQKSQCMSSVIDELQKEATDDSICSKYENDMQKNQCINNINTRLGNCMKLTDLMMKSSCESKSIQENAIEKGNIGLCNKLVDFMQKNKCMYDVTIKKSIKAKDINLCNSLDQIEQNICKSETTLQIALIENSIEYCDTYTEGSAFCKQQFAKKMILKNYDMSLCTYFANKSDCEVKTIIRKAISIGDETVCDSLLQTNQKNQCRSFYTDTFKQLDF